MATPFEDIRVLRAVEAVADDIWRHQFLYYARGSLFETKYWLNRALARELLPSDEIQKVAAQLTDIARQLNVFAASLKSQRRNGESRVAVMREASVEYAADISDEVSSSLFSDGDLTWLEAISSAVSNL